MICKLEDLFDIGLVVFQRKVPKTMLPDDLLHHLKIVKNGTIRVRGAKACMLDFKIGSEMIYDKQINICFETHS